MLSVVFLAVPPCLSLPAALLVKKGCRASLAGCSIGSAEAAVLVVLVVLVVLEEAASALAGSTMPGQQPLDLRHT